MFNRNRATPEQSAAVEKAAREQAAAAEQARLEAEEQFRLAVVAFQEQCTAQVRRTQEEGLAAWQYKSVYIDLDPQYHDVREPIAPSVAELDYWGRRGWEVVATFPRTYSGTEVHRHKKVAKGGALVDYGKKVDQTVSLSANVVGAHVLLRRRVSAESYEWPSDWSEINLWQP